MLAVSKTSVKRDDDRPDRVLDYSGPKPVQPRGHSAEGVASLVAGCVSALGLALLFTRKFPPQVEMMVVVAAFFVSVWGVGFGLHAIRRNPHEPFALVGLCSNAMALVITTSLGGGACCFGSGSFLAPSS